MSEKLQGVLETNPDTEILQPMEFSELGSLDPNVDQNLLRLSGTV
ncbi:hypothetical protein [Sporomusa sp.]|nr:hypothetical protein [Sporomusa sp.]HWR08761.1 hypothetical protein [Sporomusa sp.]